MDTIGQKAENKASEFLQKKGYSILLRNYRFGRFEVDLVCGFKGQIVIVEVKSLRSLRFKQPYEAVNMAKQQRIVRVASHLLKTSFPDQECRFDIVSIFIQKNRCRIEHICDAFSPQLNAGC